MELESALAAETGQGDRESRIWELVKAPFLFNFSI